MGIGLVTGSRPFAGLPDSPAETLLSLIDGMQIGATTIKAVAIDVSLDRVPQTITGLIAQHRPDFVVSLGLAPGEPVLRLETTAINRLDFGVADNDGRRPTGGGPIDPVGPAARMASWDAPELVAGLLAVGLPARVSHHAGTHLCNVTLYKALGAMQAAQLPGPCGFFHFPYLPDQVARFLSGAPSGGDTAPLTQRALPSMALELQLAALRLVLHRLTPTSTGEVS